MERGEKIISVLGKGRLGDASLIKRNNQLVVRKTFSIDVTKIEDVKNDCNLLKDLKNRNIVPLKDYEIHNDEGKCYLYFDYIQNDNLNVKIEEKNKKKESFTLDEMIKCMKDMINGLNFLHDQHLPHIDLKEENIFIKDDNVLMIDYISDKTFDDLRCSECESKDVNSLGLILYRIYTLNVGEVIPEMEELMKEMLENKKLKLYEIEERLNAINKTTTTTATTTTSSTPTIKTYRNDVIISDCYEDSYVLDFYLRSWRLYGKRFEDIVRLSVEEFSEFWKEKLIYWFFPSMNQERPLYNEKCAAKLKRFKRFILVHMHKLMYLVKLSQGDKYDKLMKEFLKSIEENDFIEKLESEKEFLSNCYEGLGHLRNKEYEKAIEYLKCALKLAPSDKYKFDCSVLLYDCHYGNKEYEKSIECLKSALDYTSSKSKKYRYNICISSCYLELNDYVNTKKYLNTALEYATSERRKNEWNMLLKKIKLQETRISD